MNISPVNSSLRKIRQDDNVWQELYQDITNLAEKQNVLPSKPRTAGRQQHRDNVPADTRDQKNTGDDQYTIRCSTTLPMNLRQDL